MTDDEFQRIKEAEKQRLRARRTLKALKQALAEQRAGAQGTVDRMTGRIKQLFDAHRDALNALQWDTARIRARLDLIRDTLTQPSDADLGASVSAHRTTRQNDTRQDEAADRAAEPGAPASDPDVDWRILQAEKLVDEMRAQLDANAPPPSRNDAASPETQAGNPASKKDTEDDPPTDSLPDKTIGRIPRS
ncbi:MAG: hypothetical protein PPP56_00490 [Longimonas sp.]|uniref:hypothetical protein n=1 Tax=Longimonas sp. TaxID=2039626 RepID=UPI0033507FA6